MVFWCVYVYRYVSAQKDRVTVIFSTVFTDDDDVIIGKVFMQVYTWYTPCLLVYCLFVCLFVCRSSRRVGGGVGRHPRSCSVTPSHQQSSREQTPSLEITLATSRSVRERWRQSVCVCVCVCVKDRFYSLHWRQRVCVCEREKVFP